MALESAMVPLGSPLPAVSLPDVDGQHLDLQAYQGGQPLLVVFACNHCPYVRHVERPLAAMVNTSEHLRTVAINPNDTVSYPDDGPEGMREQIRRAGWTFPYLIDATQDVARDFGAVCTPDFFLFDRQGRLSYRGAFDTSTPKNGEKLDGHLLAEAIDAVVMGRPAPEPQRPSMGCGIKWLT